MSQSLLLKKYTIKREKRLLSVPYEIAKKPNLGENFFRAIAKSLPDVITVHPEFFKKINEQ